MKVVVSGDRDYDHETVVVTWLYGLYQFYESNLVVIEGQCPSGGADKFAERWAKELLPPENHRPYEADWDEYGKAAGPIRNRQMIDHENPDLVLLFHDDLENSKGTADMANVARKRGIPTYHIRKVN